MDTIYFKGEIRMKTERKYDLLTITRTLTLPPSGKKVTVRRIVARVDIPRHNVKAGSYGGWIESGANLSQKGDSWVANSAFVCEQAKVSGDALIAGDSCVYGYAKISGKSRVLGNSRVQDECEIHHQVVVGSSYLEGSVVVSGTVSIFQSTLIGDIAISNHSFITETNIIGKQIRLDENCRLEACYVKGKNMTFSDNAKLNDCKIGLVGSCENVMISENVKMNNVNISGGSILGKNGIVVNGDTYLNGVIIKGEGIFIHEYASIVGDFRLGDKTEIRDFAQLRNSSDFAHNLSHILINGESEFIME